MQHFDVVDWTDFTRGLLPDSLRFEMQSHLAQGCGDCQSSLDLLTRLAATCRQMNATPDPPDAVLSRAIALFPAPPPLGKRVAQLASRLIFDSRLTPQPAGFRSGVELAWQSAYQAGDYTLDLRVEPETRSARVALVGQITNPSLSELALAGVPVYVYAGKRIVAQTLSNQFGEFQMEYRQEASVRFRLRIHLNGGNTSILVPLKKLGTFKLVTTRRQELRTAANDPGGNPAKPGRQND